MRNGLCRNLFNTLMRSLLPWSCVCKALPAYGLRCHNHGATIPGLCVFSIGFALLQHFLVRWCTNTGVMQQSEAFLMEPGLWEVIVSYRFVIRIFLIALFAMS